MYIRATDSSSDIAANNHGTGVCFVHHLQQLLSVVALVKGQLVSNQMCECRKCTSCPVHMPAMVPT